MIPAVATLTMEELLKSEPANLHKGPVTGPDGVHGIDKAPYLPDTLKWLPIGTMYDHPKSWTFMGGGVAPAEGAVILYTLEFGGKVYYPDEFAANRKQEIGWYLRHGYQSCPVSVWKAGSARVIIMHFAIRNKEDNGTLIYSQARVVNWVNEKLYATLHINASPYIHVPLNHKPVKSDNNSMDFEITLENGEEVFFDFVTRVSGPEINTEDTAGYGSFEESYKRLAEENNRHIASLAHPTILPNQGIVHMYKAIQIMLWNFAVYENDEYQIRSNAGNPARIQTYDRPFPHDVPNFLDEFMREGDYDLAKNVMKGNDYRRMNSSDIKDWDNLNYMDTIGKFTLPYAQYLQNTGDFSYFDKDMREFLKKAARNIKSFRVYDDEAHYGLMKKGEDFENWSDDGDYLLADNWSALHGLMAYRYIVDRLGDTEETAWADAEIKDLNNCLNAALDKAMERRGEDFYLGAFDDITYQRYIAGSFYSWVPYGAGLSTFPWGAALKGYKEGGTWKDKFDAAFAYAFEQRDLRMVPDGSFGAWWSKVTYGSTYNAAAGVQCLFSDRYRREAIKSVEFLYENQCAPFIWSEAFERHGKDQWAGMYIPQESYGNYEAWGSSFIKQTILQACVSVSTDGTVIIGRGIPEHWLKKGDRIAWEHVNINDGRTLDFELFSEGDKIRLTLSGDQPFGDILLDLPIMENNTSEASAGEILPNGVVRLPSDTKEVVVKLTHQIESPSA